MELVYLWVEDYKNIHKQGFNFSPRFECKFDGENLTITENKDYESIFPDNINVTAIVGENGSGKTNIITLLIKSLYQQETKKITKTEKPEILIVYLENDELYFYSNYKKNIFSSIKEKQEIKDFHNNFHLIMSFAPGQIGIFNEISDEVGKTFKANYSVEPSRRYQSSGGAGITTQIEPTSFITTLTINAIPFYFFIDDDILKDFKLTRLSKLKISNLSGIGTEVKLRNINHLLGINFFGKAFKDDLNKIMSGNENIQNDIDNFTEKLKLNRRDENLNPKLKSLQSERKILINKVNKVLKDAIKEINEFPIKKFYKKISLADIEILNLYYSFEIVNELDDNLSFGTFSTGQQVLIAYMGLIYRFMEKANKSKKESFTIIIDEVETSLHPNWQSKFLNFLIKSLEISEIAQKFKAINIILSSHSPFVLSDIPIQNVIFLNKYTENDGDIKIGNCKNFTKNISIEQTFGANIHTLLSHGFFMDGGLMGEFAKSKISEIIEILKKEQLSDDEIKTCKHIISIIGEPILQKTLEHQLNEKLNPNETELQKLEREQKKIEDKIKELKGNQ